MLTRDHWMFSQSSSFIESSLVGVVGDATVDGTGSGMKTHNATSTPAPAACQPDVVRRGLVRCAVSKLQRSGGRVIQWFLRPEQERQAEITAPVSSKIKKLEETLIKGFR
ncbi:MAG: hypothetical protein ACTIDN_06370 [Acetobacter sp.]|uniref:hypothetical protein n=1 Tax=Acetobacter sp. TaxID=440 RepID=UPI003F91944B